LEYNSPMEPSLGKHLQSIRETKGLSLEDISQKTHIRLEYLKAIEANDMEAFPSKTHLRGFLRLYAGELGVEIDKLQVRGYHLSEGQAVTSVASKKGSRSQNKESDEPKIQFDVDLEDEVDTDSSISSEVKDAIPPIEESPSEPDQRNSSAIFEEIGRKLYQRRQLISLSLDDINANIHIRTEYLSAIEKGNFDRLPSPVQAKGMLTIYAEFLNLDVDAILLNFAEGLQKQRIEKSEVPKKIKKSAKTLSPTRLRVKNFFSVDLLVIAALFLGFAAFVIWGVNRILASDTPTTAVTDLPEVSDILLATSSPTLLATPTLSGTEEGDTPTGETEQEVPLFTPMPSSFPINIVIIPRQQAWVQVTIDGEVIFTGRLLPGNAYDYAAETTLEVLTGNAGALQIYFNDQDIGSAGLIGQVEILVFRDTGLVLPTPTNTPTITATPEATSTPSITPMPSPTFTETSDETN
jgi:cytoskeleton protein RodZ